MDNFKVKHIYPEKSYDRYHFKFTLEGKEYKGDFHNGKIEWLQPHPKQDLSSDQLEWLESEIHRLVEDNTDSEGINDDLEKDIEVESMLKNQSREAHQFKLHIDGEEFKGMLRHGKLEWFHPKPRSKVENKQVEKIEKKVHEKVNEHKKQE